MIEHGIFIINALNEISHKYRHISTRLETTWGTRACHDFFRSLLTLDSHGHGFNCYMYSLIMFLYAIHLEQYGDFGDPVKLHNFLNIDTDSLPE